MGDCSSVPFVSRIVILVADLRKGLNAHPESQGINVVYQELNILGSGNWLLDMQEVEFLSGLKMGGLVLRVEC